MTIKLALSLVVLGVSSLMAAPVLTLAPSGGSIAGRADATVGWGFDLSSDSTDWVSVIGIVPLSESNPALGVITDLIGPQGGPGMGALAPGSADWIQAFDPIAGTGLASFTIAQGARTGDFDSGSLRVLYELFSADPSTCGDCLVGTGSADAGFQVSVTSTATVPEPGGASLSALAGLALLALSRMGRQRG
jgi:hypothetical protein